MLFSQEEFRHLAATKGRSANFIDNALAYARNLVSNGAPVIFSSLHLAEILGISIQSLNSLIERRNTYYKFYQISKRSNKEQKRQIMAPLPFIKSIQNYILNYVLANVEQNVNAHAYTKGKSILTNAAPHQGSESILNIDLFRFFDTITEASVANVFCKLGYKNELAITFAKLCTALLPNEYLATLNSREYQRYRRLIPIGTCVLPQGAPTSPKLSNLIMHAVDQEITMLCLSKSITYTRYADDMTFSGLNSSLPNHKDIQKILSKYGLLINWNKVGVYKRGMKQYVTGLTTTNGVHVQKKFKKEVKKHIYCCLKFGVKNHLMHLGIKNYDRYRDWLLGKIFFINQIEPDIAQKLLLDFNKIEWH